MPVPVLIIDRELALDRDVTPDDFTESECEEILEMLPRCLRGAHSTLQMMVGRFSPGEVLKAAEWVGVLEDHYEDFSNANAETEP